MLCISRGPKQTPRPSDQNRLPAVGAVRARSLLRQTMARHARLGLRLQAAQPKTNQSIVEVSILKVIHEKCHGMLQYVAIIDSTQKKWLR